MGLNDTPTFPWLFCALNCVLYSSETRPQQFHSDDVAMQRPDWSVTANQLRFKLRFLLFNAAQYRGIYIFFFFQIDPCLCLRRGTK